MNTRLIELLNNRGVLLGDGAMGTMIQANAAGVGVLPETLNLTHPEIIRAIHDAYFAAGSDYVSTNTFGANSLKPELRELSVARVVRAAVEIARASADAAGGRLVALDMGPLGKLLAPLGDLTADEAYALFREQAEAGAEAGADFVVVETMIDILEMKAAVLAIKECCELPVSCSLTFEQDGRMLAGTDPVTAVHILQDMGIDLIGVNCSLGPRQMLPTVEKMLAVSRLPLIVKPNAGLPRGDGGRAVYDVGPREFAEAAEEMLDAGVAVIGGCCGTTPEYIKALRDMLDRRIRDGKSPCAPRAARFVPSACSATRTVLLDGSRLRIVGERLNPTGKSRMRQALKDKDYDYVEDEALAQLRAGADILEINVGMPETDETETMLACVGRLENGTDAPLMIDCTDAGVIEKALRVCRGKPVINSVNGESRRMGEIFPIVKKYGTSVVALLLDENGIPESAEGRIEILKRIIAEAEKYGICKERLIVDCLALTVSAQQDACAETLEAIRTVKTRYGLRCTLGVSNISFGLPERSLINRTFLSMAMLAGLDTPILDPTNRDYADAVRSGEVLLGKDRDAADYISYITKLPKPPPDEPTSGSETPSSGASRPSAYVSGKNAGSAKTAPQTDEARERELESIILQGFEGRAAAAAETLLEFTPPMDIIESVILPALGRVGDDYESGEIFLPQMIKSAETAKNAMKVLRERMSVQGEIISRGLIILATVKDDIHDIGKNIVKIVMENYGYEIIDLGKDVPPELIVKTAKEQGVRMVGLSALMTTTVVNMEKTISLLKAENVGCLTVVGGAVLNDDYAKKIGADHYCRTAMDAVHVADKLFK
ncbi:MAG: homocysteine S-methyltransferase family protein [Clostridiales Family XIII bacterium]|jgi:5-methyltetrahydrofolate--homocysteine methyltransferase|nr:homocysteine S-methyltransferase family protein [Clostridiales Family XIII bacterium]